MLTRVVMAWLGLLLGGCSLGDLDNPRDPQNQITHLNATAQPDRRISLAWEKPENPRYRGFLVLASGPGGWVRQVETQDTHLDFTQLVPNQLYGFSVQAHGPSGVLSQPVEVHATAKDNIAPNEVVNPSGTMEDGTVVVVWETPSSPDLARIHLSWVPVGALQGGSLDLPPEAKTASIPGLKPSAAYAVTLQTEDDQLNRSPGRSLVVFTVPLAEVPPGSVSFGGGAAKVSPFLMGRFEVSQSLFLAVTGKNNSFFRNGEDSAFLPVEQVTWYEAAAFCNSLSVILGRDQVYAIGLKGITCDPQKNGFRLPTEAEWAWAAQEAHLNPPYQFSGGNNIDAVGWLLDNSLSATHLVGSKAPNALGLYDLSGNVWEWTGDWSGALPPGDSDNPTGPLEGTGKVARGGSYVDGASWATVGRRFSFIPGSSTQGLGIRVVCRNGPQP